MATTIVPQELFTAWSRWHSAREHDLGIPHGWLSITGFHWLSRTPQAFEGLPGTWHVDGDRAALKAESSDDLVVADGSNAGTPVNGTLTASVPEAGSLHWVRHGDLLVELVLRGGRYAIRLRDPRAPERAAFTGIPAFPVDPAWIRSGQYTPFDEPRAITVDTARADLRQQVTAVGTVRVDIAGRDFTLTATAGQAGRLNLSFTDVTNGLQTAPWRVVSTSIPTETGALVVDFNRAVNLPFSFTEFGTCPAPVKGNDITVAVTAGEKAPIRVTGPTSVAAGTNDPARRTA